MFDSPKIIGYLFVLGQFLVSGYILYLVIRALKKYISQNHPNHENNPVLMNLASRIKEKRMKAQMTQEFVAESLGVSRQAVSKWETGASDPSTRNLIELANLFEIDVKELLS